MQILPSNGVNDVFGIYGNGSENAGDFYSAMNDALSAVQDGDALSADSALEENDPQVESPYTKSTSDGVTYTMSEVLFTKEELAELRLALLKEGAPQESLKQFDILADQPGGATLAQVMASLMAHNTDVKISEADELAITGLLSQLDPTGDLAANVLAKMRNGNGQGALGLILNSLNELNGTLDIDPETMLALGRGLGLNADSLRQLAAGFGGLSSLSLNGEQFAAFMTPANNQFMQEAANAAKLEGALEKTLRPIISKARNRMEQEKLASERESRRVQQSRILIDKTVQEQSRAVLDETVAGQSNDAAGKKSKMTGHAGENNLEEMLAGKAANTDNAGNAKSALNAAQEGPAARSEHFAGQDAHFGAQQENKGKSDGWNELFAKVESKGGPSVSTASSIIYSMLQGEVEAEPAFMAGQFNEAQPMLSQQLANQVQQGLLTAMRDGATRLDLQLHPAELGSLAITLIARNGEVTALIRSEKSETAEMMQRQADTIRVNLEQQGIRVDKIEVQLENRQDNNTQNAFDDLSRHNSRQEEEAARQEMQRMRNLAALRKSDMAAESVLAQSMHNMGQTARYAGQALHVVA